MTDYDQPYTEALRLFADADQYPVFPFFTANQVDKADSPEEGSNTLLRHQLDGAVPYVLLGAARLPDGLRHAGDVQAGSCTGTRSRTTRAGTTGCRTRTSSGRTASAADGGSIRYRSWIHHTILGATNFTTIEDAMGLRSRADGKIELDPIDIDWPYFTANNVRYHDRDLTVTWDETGDHYGADVPAGYSVFLDGELAFTVDDLSHVVYDPATGSVGMARATRPS